jgi:hypothetical protein
MRADDEAAGQMRDPPRASTSSIISLYDMLYSGWGKVMAVGPGDHFGILAGYIDLFTSPGANLNSNFLPQCQQP